MVDATIEILDAQGVVRQLATEQATDGVHYPVHAIQALPLPDGAASESKQDDALQALGDILEKIVAGPATEAKQDEVIAALASIESALGATEGLASAQNQNLQIAELEAIVQTTGQTAGNTEGVATAANQSTANSHLSDILSRLVIAPATEAKQDEVLTALAQIEAVLTPTDGLATATNQETANGHLETVANAVADLATSANQQTANGHLSNILNALADQATAANQSSIIAALGDVLSAFAGLARESKQDDLITVTGRSAPARNADTVTPDDNADLPNAGTLWVGEAGDVNAIPVDGSSAVLFTNVPAGFPLPVEVGRVLDSDTTAGNLVVLY